MKIDKQKQGRTNRRKGAEFEKKVRKHLEERGWIVDKWTNNVKEVETNDGKLENIKRLKLVPARSNRFNSRSCGFPDFVCFKNLNLGFKVMAVECKTRKYLDKEEKAKVQWYLENKIFGKIYVAYEDKKEIEFISLEKEKK